MEDTGLNVILPSKEVLKRGLPSNAHLQLLLNFGHGEVSQWNCVEHTEVIHTHGLLYEGT